MDAVLARIRSSAPTDRLPETRVVGVREGRRFDALDIGRQDRTRRHQQERGDDDEEPRCSHASTLISGSAGARSAPAVRPTSRRPVRSGTSAAEVTLHASSAYWTNIPMSSVSGRRDHRRPAGRLLLQGQRPLPRRSLMRIGSIIRFLAAAGANGSGAGIRAGGGPAALVERRRRPSRRSSTSSPTVTTRGRPRLRPASPSASPSSTTTARSGPSSRCTSSSSSCSTGSRRWPPSIPSGRRSSRSRPSSKGDMKAALAARREGARRADRGHAHRHDHRRVRARPSRTGSTTAQHPRFKRPYTELVYQPMLELLAYLRGQRLQDLHRVRRRHRVHAAVGRAGLRHPARAGRRQQRQARSSRCATASRC